MSDAADLLARARGAFEQGLALEARLFLVAALAATAPATKPVLVGGSAADFWAAEATAQRLQPAPHLRASLDVDVVSVGAWNDARRLRLAMHASGLFEPASPIEPAACRTWFPKALALGVDVMDDDLAGDPSLVVQLDIDGASLWVWGPEDTAWHYAQAAYHMGDRNDWTRALAIAAAQTLDWPYIERRAADDHVPEVAAALREQRAFDEMLEP